MSEFKAIDKKIQKLQNSHLSDYGKELLTELQRLKKEHSEMLEMLKFFTVFPDSDFEDFSYNDKFTMTVMAYKIAEAKQLIKEVEL